MIHRRAAGDGWSLEQAAERHVRDQRDADCRQGHTARRRHEPPGRPEAALRRGNQNAEHADEQAQRDAEGVPDAVGTERRGHVARLERAQVLELCAAQHHVVGVVELDARCSREQPVAQHALVLAQRRVGRSIGPMQRELAGPVEEAPRLLLDAQRSLHGEAQHGGREAAVVVGHATQEAHGRRRQPRGRLVAGHDDLPRWIAADPVPHPEVVHEQQREASEREARRPGVAQQVAGALVQTRRRDVTLRPARHEGQSFPRTEAPRAAEGREARTRVRLPVAPLRALRPGVGLDGDRGGVDVAGQEHLRAHRVDREVPAVARHVPVQLVVIGEEAELPVGAIGDGVGVLARRQVHLRVADSDAHTVRQLLEGVWFHVSVAADRDHLEAGHHAPAVPVDVAGREVAQQAAPDLLAFRPHPQCLDHLERAVRSHVDVALPVEDALVGPGGGERQEQREREQQSRHGSNSKYSAGTNRSSRATSRSGKVAIRVLRLFTAPL